MALVEQLGVIVDRWNVQLAVICQAMALVFAIMHLYNFCWLVLFCFYPFHVSMNLMEQ